MVQTAKVIETSGEVVEDSGHPSESIPPLDLKDVPVYSISKAIEWMKRPENAHKIEELSRQARAVQDGIAKGIDREVTKVGRLMVDIHTDDNVLEDFTNSFLKSLIGDD